MPEVLGSGDVVTVVNGGRRARNMREKKQRIFDAAHALFDEHGFEAVTTQAVSDRADVAAGTLFRYASSKGELLLMVYNEEFREAIEAGKRNAERVEDPVDAVFALVKPVVAASDRHPQNLVIYQRELLFGDPEDQHRAEGLALVDELEEAIATRLVRLARASDGDDASLASGAARSARSVFAVVNLLIARPATGAHWGADPMQELREQITQIVYGFLATVNTTSSKGGHGK